MLFRKKYYLFTKVIEYVHSKGVLCRTSIFRFENNIHSSSSKISVKLENYKNSTQKFCVEKSAGGVLMKI